jgi:hypothetical protein
MIISAAMGLKIVEISSSEYTELEFIGMLPTYVCGSLDSKQHVGQQCQAFSSIQTKVTTSFHNHSLTACGSSRSTTGLVANLCLDATWLRARIIMRHNKRLE